MMQFWIGGTLVISIVAVLFIRGATRDITDEEKDAEGNPIRVP